jgi:predicted negative regulator of RcsB-dependent stress response
MIKILFILILAVVAYWGYHFFKKYSTESQKTILNYAGALKQAETKAKSVARAIDLKSVQRAIQQFYVNYNKNPMDLKELVSKGYLPYVPGNISYNPNTGKAQQQ